MSFSLSLHFLPVLSLQTSLYSTLKFILFFWSHNEYKIVFSINQSLILKCLVSGDSRLVTNVEYALFDSKCLQMHQNAIQ